MSSDDVIGAWLSEDYARFTKERRQARSIFVIEAYWGCKLVVRGFGATLAEARRDLAEKLQGENNG